VKRSGPDGWKVDLMKSPRTFAPDIARAQMLAPNLADPNLPPSSTDRPYGSVGQFDIKFAARLPAPTKEMLAKLAEDAFASGSLGLALHHKCMDLSVEIGGAEQALARSNDPSWTVRPTPAAIEARRGEIQSLKAERLRVLDRQRDADGNAGAARRLLENIRQYVARIDRNAEIKLYTGPSPTLRRGETAIDAVEAARRRLGELRANVTRIQTAPYPASYLKAKSRDRIEAMAKRGAPDAFAAVEQDHPVIWPTTPLTLPDGSVTPTPDVMAVMAHLFKKQMIQAESDAIDASADDANALTDDDRAKALEQTHRDISAIERDETFFVREANETGANIQFRMDTDPRALLGIC
jgi:hypothetical protein